MNLLRKITFIRVLFLALLAIIASAAILSAEDYSGKFTVPNQITWGKAILPPGDYEFKLNMNLFPYTLKINGKDTAVFVFASGMTDTARGGQSSLIVLRRGGKGIVRSLFLANEGRVYTYNLPKGEPPLVASEPLLIQRIPVVVSGK